VGPAGQPKKSKYHVYIKKNKRTKEQKNKRTKEQKNKRTKEQKNKRTKVFSSFFALMHRSMLVPSFTSSEFDRKLFDHTSGYLLQFESRNPAITSLDSVIKSSLS